MTARQGNFTSARSRSVAYQQRGEDAQQAREDERIKALYHLYRTRQMDVAEILGIAPGPVLVSMWRDHLE